MIGSFRSLDITPHLHGDCNFTNLTFETVRDSLTFHARPQLLDKVFRYITTVRVTAPIELSLYIKLLFSFLAYGPANRRGHYS